MSAPPAKDEYFVNNINRQLHPELLASRGQLPNQSPNGASTNMVRVDEIERIQKAAGK